MPLEQQEPQQQQASTLFAHGLAAHTSQTKANDQGNCYPAQLPQLALPSRKPSIMSLESIASCAGPAAASAGHQLCILCLQLLHHGTAYLAQGAG